MGRMGGVAAVVLAAVSLAACGVEAGAGVRPSKAGDTGSTSRARPTTTTTTRPEREVDADDGAEVEPAAIPWAAVLAALETPAGHVERNTEAVRPGGDGGGAADGFRFEEVTDFDQDGRMVLRDLRGATQRLALPEGPLRMFSVGDHRYFTTFWLGPKCGAEWVRVDGSVGPAIPALFGSDGAFPLEPMRSLAAVDPKPSPARVEGSATVWKVDLPATDALPLGFENRYPAVWKALAAQKVTAEVDYGGAGLTVTILLPTEVLATAGAVEAGAVPNGASLNSFWTLTELQGAHPVPMSEPTSVAPDSSCVVD